MDNYDNYAACSKLTAFVDSLSNWYVRRSRDRFWAEDKQDADKLDAYWTLFETLTTVCKAIAPFTPFLSEAIWKNLTKSFGDTSTKSVHLCDYPMADEGLIDETLSRQMSLLREIASLGLSARMNAKLKVRQPLSGVTVVLNNPTDQAWLETHDGLLKTELNVRDVTYTTDAGDYVTYQVVPNFKLLGPRVGKLMPKVKAAFGAADGKAILESLSQTGKASLDVDGNAIELTEEDVEVRLQANEGWAAAQGVQAVVVLSTELTPELIRAGLTRDMVRLVQDYRKELDLQRTDRIKLTIETDADELTQAIEENRDYLAGEVLATEVLLGSISANAAEREIGEYQLKISIEVA